jgi:D-3-phosphoglycerate dehydrogenase / 2-oxoglutarate reductase
MKTQTKVFIATSSFSELTKSVNKIAKKKNFLFEKNPLKKKLTSDQLVKYAKNCNYIIAGTEIYNQKTLDKLKKLKYIFRLGSGIDNLDIDYLKKKKIKFKKSIVTPEIAVAELIVGYIFSIYRHIVDHNNDLKNKIWKKRMGSILNGKTVGIIGYGKVGKYLYKLLKNFGIKILVNDKKKINIENTNINKLIKKSDIISLNTNLYSKEKLLDKKKLKLCKKNCIIINTSRPEVIDYNYLYLMLKTKKILGAGLDVFMKEPYLGKLTNLDNVILTPHIGSYSKEIRSKMEKEALKNILKRSA